jgi:hypothetical protein
MTASGRTREMNNRLIITDIDQTITTPGIDIWEQITTHLVEEGKKKDYKNDLFEFKGAASSDPVGASKRMMRNAINMFADDVDSSIIYAAATEKINVLKANNCIRESSVEFLSRFITDGGIVVLSTANYQEAACAIRDTLFEDEHLRKNVIVSGSVIDWDARNVKHINVAKNKISGILHTLKITEDELKARTFMVFGDDPVINDIALFTLNKSSSYLMETPKNKQLEIPSYIKRSSWAEVNDSIFS